ncbi:MAG: type II toxin-antitoxin system HipA family toxin [Nitrospirae bacterium]|nr:type II toxin-antitoxin system HipA family toxin [Nitrospirota bacterium]
MSKVVEVKLWGTEIGYLAYPPGQTDSATFVYDEEFMKSGIQLSPIQMAYPPKLFTFPDISRQTFKGLPGIFADSLPDKYGNQLIDIFMAEKKIPLTQVTSLDRLLYVGTRSMGAFEYHPAEKDDPAYNSLLALDISLLSELAEMVLSQKEELFRRIHDAATKKEALNLIRVGSSAGGARAKALVARDRSGRFFDGTVEHAEGYSYWIIKFDSAENSDRDSNDLKGMTKIEYIYSIIARQCGINMPETDFIMDGSSFHFLVKRFDRDEDGKKLHYSSWAGLAHADRETTGAYSYEQLVLTARQLGLGQDDITELYRRAVFNIVGRNQDDHTKNFGFQMNRAGQWSLSPAFDMTYAFDPTGRWTRTHQIRLNKKQDDFTLNDLLAFGSYCNLSAGKSRQIAEEVVDAFTQFKKLAKQYKVLTVLTNTITMTMRTDF